MSASPVGKGSLPLGEGVAVLNRDSNGLVALLKPVGLLSHPNEPKEVGRALLKAPYDLKEECYRIAAAESERDNPVWLLNRLDSATSGVLLCATDPEVAAVVRKQFAEGGVKKTYFALVFGIPSPARQIWRDRLQVSRNRGHLRTSAEGGSAAETEAILKRAYPGPVPVSLVELHPRTGRTHQLRVQCAQRNWPIIGDETYGNFALNREFARRTGRKRLFLHSAEVKLTYRLHGRVWSFSARAPLPPEFSPK
jgi:tRNA pseudouridine65 synthase